MRCKNCKAEEIKGWMCDDCDRELTIDETEESLDNSDIIELNHILCLYRVHFSNTRSTTKSEAP